MNAAALGALERADLILFMTDTAVTPKGRGGTGAADRSLDAPPPLSEPVHRGGDAAPVSFATDFDLLSLLPEQARCALVINKVDQLRDKSLLLPHIKELQDARDFVAILPVSVLREPDVERVLAVLEENLPEGEAAYAEDDLTDRPVIYFVQEYIREQVLLRTSREVPHSVAVTVDSFDAGRTVTRIAATVHVEKVGQRKILIGRGGQMIRDLGAQARHRIEQLLGVSVYLKLFVRVTPRWRNAPRQLAELGYASPQGAMPVGVVTEAFRRKPRQRRKT